MTPGVDCGDCNDFHAKVVRSYQPFLSRHGFEFSECSAEFYGRECVIMYTGPECKLLFVLTDGAEMTALADGQASFPPNGWDGKNGENGWFGVVSLMEFLSGRTIMTRKLVDEFVEHTRDYYEWEAALMSEWDERLLALFAPGTPPTWSAAVAAHPSKRGY
jgi:hypothetical protein